MVHNVEILAKRKGRDEDWKPMNGIVCLSVDDAKSQLRKRSEVMDRTFDFAIRVTTIEEYLDELTPS